MSRKFLVVSALVLASALTACSSDDGKDDEKKKQRAELQVWAAKVCAIDVTARIDDARGALADVGKVIPGEQPATLKTRLAADIAKLADADDKLAEALDRAGAPAVPDGPVLRTTVVTELQNAAKGWSAIQVRIEGLATDQQNVFADGLRSLDPEIKAMQASSHTALDKLHRGDAGKALAAVPGCAAGKAETTPTAPSTAAPSGSGTPTTSAPTGASSSTPTPTTSAPASASASGASTAAPSGGATASPSSTPSRTSGTTAPPA